MDSITNTYQLLLEKGGEAPMEKKLYYTAKDVAEMLDVSVSHLWGFFFCSDTYMIPIEGHMGKS